MDLILFSHLFNGLWMLALPIGLAIFLTRRFRMSWRLVWIGAATFILSQVGHIPFNSFALNPLLQALTAVLPPGLVLLASAILLGLSAGLFEEGSRYLVLRYWAKGARSWGSGLLFGAGHGGMEAIILGVFVLATFVNLVAIRGTDLATIVPPAQLATAQQQVAAYWGVPWYDALLGALERTLTIPCQIAMAVLVMQAFTRGKLRWLWLAVLYHALLDAVAVYLMGVLGQQSGAAYIIEGGVAVFTLLSLALILLLRQPEPPAPAGPPPPPPPVPLRAIEPPVTPENLETSRFQ